MGRAERSPVRPNRTRRKLASGRVVVRTVIGVPSPELVELAGALGFDFVTVDAEHESIDDRPIVHMILAAEAFGVTPVVRLAKDPDRILRVLDAGGPGYPRAPGKHRGRGPGSGPMGPVLPAG